MLQIQKRLRVWGIESRTNLRICERTMIDYINHPVVGEGWSDRKTWDIVHGQSWQSEW